MRKSGKDFVQKIALERIWRLFELADAAFNKHPERSKRYVELARKISTRNKVRMPRELKQKFCRKCGAFLKQGKNAKLRVTKSYVVVSCGECGNVRKIGVK